MILESTSIIQWCLEHLNYLTITILMAIESSFIPFPSEVVVPPAAYMASKGTDLNIYAVVFFATLGSNIGAIINYYLAKWLGQPLVYKFANSRWGHLCLINQQKIEKAESYFNKHGAVSTFIGRLIPGIRQLISIPAGLSNMNISKFLFYTTLGALIWNSILAYIGYSLSKVIGIDSQEQLLAQVTHYSHEIGLIFIGIGIIIIAFWVYKAQKKRKKQIKS